MKIKTLPVLAGALAVLATPTLHAAVFDYNVDSENLGKGDWIWYVSQATNKLGGNVTSVTNIPSLMSYYQSKGINFIVVKAGEGSTNFPSASSPQFTQTLVNEAKAKGIKIFGYTRSYGVNIPGEISVITNALAKGADGYVIDAEVEWESHKLANGPTKAVQLCTGIKNAYPTRFLAHSPLPIISLHSSFPYKEFGLHCDAVMPQAYWVDLNKTPNEMVDWMDREWRNWHNSLTGADRAAIKPLAPIGQGYGNVTNGHIKAFFDRLKNDPTCVTAGGYRGISFWRTDLHTSAMWNEIGTNSIGGATPGDGSVIIDNPSATVAGSWMTASSAADRYGVDYRYKGQGTGAAYLQYRPTLSYAGDYQVYEWHSAGSNRSGGVPHLLYYNGGSANILVNQKLNGGKWNWLGTFNMAAGTANYLRVTDGFADAGQVAMADAIKFVPQPADIIIDNTGAYYVGSWASASSATDKYGADYRYKSAGTGSAFAEFIPNIPLSGYYEVYEWHSAGSNRATNAPHTIQGSGNAQTVYVNQSINGGKWNLLATVRFDLGTPGSIRIKDNFTGSVVMADAIKLVFVSQ